MHVQHGLLAQRLDRLSIEIGEVRKAIAFWRNRSIYLTAVLGNSLLITQPVQEAITILDKCLAAFAHIKRLGSLPDESDLVPRLAGLMREITEILSKAPPNWPPNRLAELQSSFDQSPPARLAGLLLKASENLQDDRPEEDPGVPYFAPWSGN